MGKLRFSGSGKFGKGFKVSKSKKIFFKKATKKIGKDIRNIKSKALKRVVGLEDF